METIMSTEKQAREQVTKEEDVVLEETPVKGVKLVALEIDEDFDVGGDPYNRTGSHCIIKVDHDE